MPLYKSVTIAPGTQLLVWKITESLEELQGTVELKTVCSDRVLGMKSELHKKGFLSVRRLMQEMGYTDFDMYYGADGKPHLTDGKNISITHSFGFSAIMIGDRNMGLDMEIRREKVVKIADKFIDNEFRYLDPVNMEDYVRRLIVIWGVKEALYKMFSRKNLSFRQNMDVDPFMMEDRRGTASVKFEDIDGSYHFFFEEIEDFTLVYSLEKLD